MDTPPPRVPTARHNPDDFPMPGTMQQRVQFVVLLQLAEHGTVDHATTLTICPGTDRRDLEAALGYLLDSRAIDGPTWRLSSFVELAEAGQFRLTAQGQEWLDGGPTG